MLAMFLPAWHGKPAVVSSIRRREYPAYAASVDIAFRLKTHRLVFVLFDLDL